MNIGLVLSGGGVRGIAHIGVIKALQENNINPTHIAGTSAGAIVGALYASGCSWEKMLDFFNSIQLFGFNKYAINKPGFIDTEKFYNSLAPFFPDDDFKSLKKILYITATNLLNGELKIFNKGELIRPILASAAFPGLFTPVKIENAYYIDGGTLNNFPVDLISRYCDQIIGVYVNPFNKLNTNDFKHSYDVVERALKIKNGNESYLKFEACDLLISPIDLNNYSTFYVKNSEEIFNLGYNNAIKILEGEKGIRFLKEIIQ
tara:strand:- start:704 stop:1486 length:783 start_codon:yes stop_codon:yes gene_type:complete